MSLTARINARRAAQASVMPTSSVSGSQDTGAYPLERRLMPFRVALLAAMGSMQEDTSFAAVFGSSRLDQGVRSSSSANGHVFRMLFDNASSAIPGQHHLAIELQAAQDDPIVRLSLRMHDFEAGGVSETVSQTSLELDTPMELGVQLEETVADYLLSVAPAGPQV
jgi:hypothetical protein